MTEKWDSVPVGGAQAEETRDVPEGAGAAVDTVIIGGGQAGLAASYHLTQEGREHIVLEKDRVGEAWRSQKWDSFTLVTPNWLLRLPGFAYTGDDPDGYLTREEVVRYIDEYVRFFNPPLRLGVEAMSVETRANGGGFSVQTSVGQWKAANVVVATGTFQTPKIPVYSRHLAPHVAQLHASRYRNPQELPPGAVLVVGSGQSGCQITEELYQSGRKVYLATGTAFRAPRRYRGKDFIWWMRQTGFLDRTVDQLESPAQRFAPNPQVTGKNGGHTLNLHQFALDGVTLLGRMKGARGTKVLLADDLMQNLTKSDMGAARLIKRIDEYIAKAGLDAPEEEVPELRAGYESEVLTTLDLATAGVTSVIWAIGYVFDYRWVKLPIFDEFGYPVQERGVTAHPGLYFLGLQWLHTVKSGLFGGIGDDAAHVVAHIAAQG
jgi:putative flavoprotein involved in K+ transport